MGWMKEEMERDKELAEGQDGQNWWMVGGMEDGKMNKELVDG